MATAALSGAYQMALADAAAVPDLRNITAELEATVALQRETLATAAADVSRVSAELAAAHAENIALKTLNEAMPGFGAEYQAQQISSLAADVMTTRTALTHAINEADRLRAELATERQAREALQEQAGTVEAVGYFVTSASHGPRYFSKRENAIRDAMKNARLGWCTRVIPAGKPIGTARRGAEWRGA